MIIGGIAVVSHGVARDTSDIDAAVWGAAILPAELLSVLARHEIGPRIDDALEFAKHHQILLVEHKPTGVTLDIALSWFPFEREAMSRATAVNFNGVDIRVATPEDIIIYKAAAWRDEDRADIRRLLKLHGHTIDDGRVIELVRQIADLLDDPQRAVILEQMIREAQ